MARRVQRNHTGVRSRPELILKVFAEALAEDHIVLQHEIGIGRRLPEMKFGQAKDEVAPCAQRRALSGDEFHWPVATAGRAGWCFRLGKQAQESVPTGFAKRNDGAPQGAVFSRGRGHGDRPVLHRVPS